jgi:hypothetical protein
MTMRLTFSLLLVVLDLQFARAQHALLKDYDWEAPPQVDEVILKKGTDVLLKRNVLTQFSEENGRMHFYNVFHMQRYLHDLEAIEENKTIQLSTGHMQELIRIKARCILPDGSVNELDSSAFLERTDDREGEGGVYFAFEGLRPGSIIEYLYLSRENGGYQGGVYRTQFALPVMEQRFEVLVPETWRFQFRTYNGMPMPIADSSHAGIIRHHVRMLDTPAIPAEKSSFEDVNRMYIVQRLDAVPMHSVFDLSGFATATRNFHKNLYPEHAPKLRKEMKVLLQDVGIDKKTDVEAKVRAIDMHIKTGFAPASSGAPELSSIEHILRTKNYDAFGLRRLYANLLREAGIEHQIVLTTDRSDSPFDATFENHSYIRDFLLYFPMIDKYLEPERHDLGLGYPGSEHTGTSGLFIRNVELGGVFAGVGSVKTIPQLPAESTTHDMQVDVRFNVDASEATIVHKNQMSGYYASYWQNFHPYMNEDQRTQMYDALLGFLITGAHEKKITVANAGLINFGVVPLQLQAEVTTNMFTHQAGDEVLFDLGSLIGPQMEMYAEEERLLPVDEYYQRRYTRTLTVSLPQGYVCRDLTPVNIDRELVMDGKVLASFRSNATLVDGKIEVTADEVYSTTHVPVEKFEAWRSVINAAADFNKVKLVLSKE